MALAPVASIAPVVLTSCSGSSSPFKSLQYGNDFAIEGGDQDAAKLAACNHLPMVNQQKTVTYLEWLDYFKLTETPELVQPTRELDPTLFYWEMIYEVANNGYYCQVKNWNVDIENNRYVLSFDYTYGIKNGSKIDWKETYSFQKQPLPFYEVDSDGGVNYRFIAKDKDGKEVNRINPSFSFMLLKVNLEDAVVFEQYNGSGWDPISSASITGTNGTMNFGSGQLIRCSNQCTFTVTGPTGVSLSSLNGDIYGILNWSNLSGTPSITLTATTYKGNSETTNATASLTINWSAS